MTFFVKMTLIFFPSCFSVSALEHNTWFTKLRASSNSSKLNAELCDRILGVVSKSISLQELHLSAIGARWDFAVKLKQALESNPCSSLQILGKCTVNYVSTYVAVEVNRVKFMYNRGRLILLILKSMTPYHL